MCQQAELQRDPETRKIPAQIWKINIPKIGKPKSSHAQPQHEVIDNTVLLFWFLYRCKRSLQNELLNYSIATAILSDLVVSSSYNLHYQGIIVRSSFRHFQVKNIARPHNVAIVKTISFVVLKENFVGRLGRIGRKL